jgi:autotransporter-associated beta strand protein
MLQTGSNNASTTFAGTFSNVALLVKQGDGTFTLTSPNAFPGQGLLIQAGTLGLGAANVLIGTAAVQLDPGSVLDLKSNPQTLQALSGNGIVALGSATLTVWSSHAIASPAGTFDGHLIGSGGLIKDSLGLMILNGLNTYTGPTVVKKGTLVVNGSIASMANVLPGASLEGTGVVKGPVSVFGTLSPGAASPGTFHSGPVTFFGPTAAFNVRLNSTASFDQLAATGPVNLNSAMLHVSLGFIPAVGDMFTIVTGPIIGQFQGLPNLSTFLINGHKFQIMYTPSDVRLKCVA